jgi:hypothetical protein
MDHKLTIKKKRLHQILNDAITKQHSKGTTTHKQIYRDQQQIIPSNENSPCSQNHLMTIKWSSEEWTQICYHSR